MVGYIQHAKGGKYAAQNTYPARVKFIIERDLRKKLPGQKLKEFMTVNEPCKKC